MSNSRPRKARAKQRLVVDSEDSEDDDFAFVPTKKARDALKPSKGSLKPKWKDEGAVKKKATDPKPKRLSRDEKLFKKDLEKALVKSTASISSTQEDPPINTSCNGLSLPARASGSMGEQTQDDSDYMPAEDNCSEEESSSDDDFQPSPPAKKLKKPSEGKKTKKAPSKKENVKVATKSVTAVKCDRLSVNTNPRPGAAGGKPSPCPIRGVGATDLPGSRPETAVKGTVTAPTTPVGKRHVAKWVPPAKAGSTDSQHMDSVITKITGGAPAIRVGLSRRAPIKPLHSLQSPLRTKN